MTPHEYTSRWAADAVLRTRDVAEFLGVCRVTVRRMAQRGDFKGAVRMGRDWRVPAASVAAYLEARAVKVNQQSATGAPRN